jgi:scyllo-inositol 2-dehydrogenase (NAD+)
MKKVKVGVIGYGRLGAHHAMNVMRHTQAELCAVADPMEQTLARAKSETGAKTYTDYRDILADPDIQAVVIASPTKFHYDILQDTIDANKSIFIEKPITYTVEEGEKIVEAVQKAGLYLQVGYMRRFDPGHVAAKKMIEAGGIGDPIYIQDCQRDPNGPPPGYVPESGGIYVDMGIHDLDCVRWLMGSEITSIYSQGAVLKHKYLTELNDVDQATMALKFASGALGNIEVSRNANDIYDTRTEIVGTKSSVFIGQSQHTPFVKVGKWGFQYDQANWCLGRFEKGYELEINAFIENVLHEKESPVTAADGLVGLKLAKLATQSYQEGAVVTIES